MQHTEKLDEFIEQIDVNAWDSMSGDERLKVFQKFEDIMAEIEGRPALEIKAISDEEYKASPGTMGYYDGESLHINPRFFKGKNALAGSVSDYSIAKALGTIAHEGRHAWQQYVLENTEDDIVDEKTWMRIMINNRNYYSPSDDYDDDLMYLKAHALYEAQIVELDARRFQKQTIEYIEKKLEEKTGETNRVFKYAVTQYIAREVSEAESLAYLFTEEELMGFQEALFEELKKIWLFDDIDVSYTAIFEDAIELLRSGDMIAFVEGEPIQELGKYSDVKKFDRNIEGKESEIKRTRITYRKKRKFR